MFWVIFSKSFPYETIKYGLQAHCGNFEVCVKNGPCGLNFRAVLVPNRAKMGQYIGFRLFS